MTRPGTACRSLERRRERSGGAECVRGAGRGELAPSFAAGQRPKFGEKSYAVIPNRKRRSSIWLPRLWIGFMLVMGPNRSIGVHGRFFVLNVASRE